MNYNVILEITEDGSKNQYSDQFGKIGDVVRYIAKETGLAQKTIREEIFAREGGSIRKDNLGIRVKVEYYTNAQLAQF